MDWNNLGAGLGVVGVVAGGLVVAFGSMSRTLRQTQRENVDALNQRCDLLELANSDCERKNEVLQARVTTQERDLGTLRDLVTSKAAVEVIAETLHKHNEVATAGIARIETGLSDLKQMLRGQQ